MSRKLHTTLGSWLTITHQRWEWYIDMSSKTVYLHENNTSWTAYKLVTSPLQSTHNTRQTKIWYNKNSCHHSDPDSKSIVPTTVYIDQRYLGSFQTDHSDNAIPVTTPKIPNMTLWDLPNEDMHSLTHQNSTKE